MQHYTDVFCAVPEGKSLSDSLHLQSVQLTVNDLENRQNHDKL